MSKINKIRFVNLNYNNNTMKIDDESFYLDGENTMLNLRNGGGKSVLVQMVIAPFVNKRYRNIKDRNFESYFTSSIPTYILIEWKMDDEAGYLLTGMMVRKKEAASDENSKEKLDIINFINEYKGKNEYDIESIPVIEEKNGKKIIKSYVNSKQLFENLKKDRNLKFNYYDMNNSLTTKNYFNKLEECGINHKEWENIIKKINIKESGLSELFTKAKDSSSLVREWFLPAIENKLKVDEDRIQNYRELIDRYVKQYRANKANIDKKAKMELFKDLSKNLIIFCDDFIDTNQEKEALKNKIANVIIYLKQNFKNKEEEVVYLENLIKLLEDKITNLNYERESIKIYEKKDEITSLEDTIKRKTELISESEIRKKNLIKKGNIIECAKIHREYQNTSKELQQYETELDILNKKNENNAPRINNLGFTIKGILEKEAEIVKNQKEIKFNLKIDLEKEKEILKNSLEAYRRDVNYLNKQEGSLISEISHFDKIEQTFNEKYKESLFRNISGYFDDEKLLLIYKKINEEDINLNKERKSIGENILSGEENLKTKESEKQRNLEKFLEIKNNLKNKEGELKKAEEEIEKRKEIIKYIDFKESKVLESESIINAFDIKINLVKEEKLKLTKICDNKTYELEKFKTGKVLDLPKDIERKLRERDINITYGMEWLKKNGCSLEDNEKFVQNNPFIPYSLIMDSKEIEILEKESLDIFTSSPVSIINRKNLEDNFNNIKQKIVDLDMVKFFISFNNKLLNEKELLKLIEDKEKEIKELEQKINEKEENIKFYEEKRNFVKYSSLTSKIYEDLKEKIQLLNNEIPSLRKIEIELEKEIAGTKENIKQYEKKLKLLDKSMQDNLNKSKTFKELKEDYEKYKKNKLSLQVTLERLKVITLKIDKDEKRNSEIQLEITECNDSIRFYESKEIEILNKVSIFNIYKEGELIKKDKEDLISEYNALTKDITSSEKELKRKIEELSKKFNEVENELNIKADKYEIKETQYINETYDIHKELENKDELKKEEKNYENLKEQSNKFNEVLAVAKSKLEDLYRKLKERFDKEEPKEKELLIPKNFKEDIEKLQIEIKETDDKKDKINKLKLRIENNLTNLSEFNDFVITESVDIAIDFNELDEYIGKLKRDLRNISDSEIIKEKNLTNLVVDIEIRDEFKKEALFKNPIQTLKSLVSNPVEFKEQLNIVVNSYERIIEKLMADIELIQKEEGKILDSLLEYIRDVHENIEKIDDNSSINIGSKRLKMLNISVASWEENKEFYKVRLKEYVDNIRNQGLEVLEKNEDIEDIISNKINIHKLYDEVVGIGSVNIKLYKIEEDKQRQITWDEVSKNSGGEGFLSAFVILSSLLSYMRKNETDIFTRKESGKVLIMDNPFAQTSSAHLLKPLIDIAKKSNTQLVCLTGLGGDSIYNRFDNIYVLNLIPSKLKSGIKFLKSEHIKGEEEKEVIVAARFKIEEQTKLF